MDNPPDIFGEARRVCLSPDERRTVRLRLMEHCDKCPVRKNAARLLFWILRAVPTFGIALSLMGMSAGGLAYAAEDTVPGDTLYTVKTGFTEPLISLMYRGGKRGEWELRRTERRLLELERLAMNTQSPEEQERFQAHMAAQERVIERLTDRIDDYSNPAEAETLREELAEMLDAHAALLESCANGKAPNSADVIAFTDTMRLQGQNLQALRTTVAAAAEPIALAQNVQQRAAEVQRDMQRLRSNDGAEENREELRQVEREMLAVQQALRAGKLGQAEELVRAGRRRVRELQQPDDADAVIAALPPSPSQKLQAPEDAGEQPTVMMMLAATGTGTDSGSGAETISGQTLLQ